MVMESFLFSFSKVSILSEVAWKPFSLASSSSDCNLLFSSSSLWMRVTSLSICSVRMLVSLPETKKESEIDRGHLTRLRPNARGEEGEGDHVRGEHCSLVSPPLFAADNEEKSSLREKGAACLSGPNKVPFLSL